MFSHHFRWIFSNWDWKWIFQHCYQLWGSIYWWFSLSCSASLHTEIHIFENDNARVPIPQAILFQNWYKLISLLLLLWFQSAATIGFYCKKYCFWALLLLDYSPALFPSTRCLNKCTIPEYPSWPWIFHFRTATCTKRPLSVSFLLVLHNWFSASGGSYLIKFGVSELELIDIVIAIDEIDYFLPEMRVASSERLLQGEARESEVFLYHTIIIRRHSITPSVFASFPACPPRSSPGSNWRDRILPCLRRDERGTNWCRSSGKWEWCDQWCMLSYHSPRCFSPQTTTLMHRSWTASCSLSTQGPGCCWHWHLSSRGRIAPWISLSSKASLCQDPLTRRWSWDWKIWPNLTFWLSRLPCWVWWGSWGRYLDSGWIQSRWDSKCLRDLCCRRACLRCRPTSILLRFVPFPSRSVWRVRCRSSFFCWRGWSGFPCKRMRARARWRCREA